MALLLKGARFVDPLAGVDRVADMVVRDGLIVEIGESLTIPKGIEVDCAGRIVMPGFVDIHTHLREPGGEDAETIRSGTRAAARGGYTAVCPMPNTNPVCDTAAAVGFVLKRAAESGVVRVHPIGALTKGLKGESIAEIGDMLEAGAVAFSDDGKGIQDAGVLRRVMEYARQFDTVVISHCEIESLSDGGAVNEGAVSSRLGLPGCPALAEEAAIERDIAMAELTGCRLHIAHCSTAHGLDMVRRARERGVAVTVEVTPHHLFLSEDDIDSGYDTSLKMSPPLRTEADRLALIEGLVDGTVDAIATDHAPHAPHKKALEFELAPFGTTGLETTVPLVLDRLVASGTIALDRVVSLLAHGPRRCLGLDPVTLAPGSVADLTFIDLEAPFTVDAEGFESQSVNSAFLGLTLQGCVTDTYVGGYAVFQDGEVVGE